MFRSLLLSAALLSVTFSSQAQERSALRETPPPRLVVVISIDQFRADYLQRFAPFYLPPRSGAKVGGFRYLTQSGAEYMSARQAHLPTATGPGHAALLTGSAPALNGIIGNEWFDLTTGQMVYCVDDPLAKTVGGASKPMSPRKLLTSTVGDELKAMTNGKAKVVGIAYKDRASILMAGHAADDVIWMDAATGDWVSSDFYYPDMRLPAWVRELNSEGSIQKLNGKRWEPLLPNGAYAAAKPAPGRKEAPGGKPFSHELQGSGRGLVGSVITSAFGNEIVFRAVSKAVDADKLGQDDIPDLLAVSLSANDYVGHAFGPNSPEAMDMSIRTDRLLSDLLNELNRKVPGGLARVVIAITADHGVVPVPEEMSATYRMPSKRYSEGPKASALNKGLSEKYGGGKWVLAITEPNLYLNRALAAQRNVALADLRAEAARIIVQVPGVYTAFTAEQILNNQLPNWPWTSMVALNFNPKLGGDLIVVEEPGSLFSSLPTGTSHGTPWSYDSQVPLLISGPGVRVGRYARSVTLMDLAPTLSLLLGSPYPTGNMGQPLFEAIGDR